MKYIVTLLSLIIAFGVIRGYSQETKHYSRNGHGFNHAMKLYEHKNYSAAQKVFRNFIARSQGEDNALLREDARYYAAICAMKLYNRDVQHLIESFIHDHPENPNINQASFQLANYYYRKTKYRTALKWYEKVDRLSLPEQQLSEYYFKKGYCHYARKDFNIADKAFYEIKDKNDFYGPLAKYFYSHIKYLNKQYQTALEGFQALSDHALFAKIVPFYITQIYLFQEKYQKIIDYAPPLLKEISGERTNEIARIIAEAYFKKANYQKSLEYFNLYEKNIEELNDVDFYKIGFSHYKNENYQQATSYLQEVIGVKDSLTQNAAYHLGMSYAQIGDKNRAKTAFGIASQNDFDENITEEALFNYAKLCFELDYSPFNESINSLKKFINNYPNSVHIDKAYDYLLQAVLVTKNYQASLKVIEDIPDKTPEINKAYQRLAYFRALEFFSDLKYQKAIDYFNKSLEYKQYDETYRALAYYWKADAHYRLKNYDKAIDIYNTFLTTRGVIGLDEYGKAHYNLAYAKYKKEKYSEAGIWFRKYDEHVGNEKTKMHADAFNRIGDCYFVDSKFDAALKYYSKAANLELYDADYSYYQKAICQGRVKKHQNKVQTLKKLKNKFPKSQYKAEAIYEIGRTYHSNIENNQQAINFYKKYVDDYPQGARVRSALSSLANLYYNQNKLDKSLDTYKTVIAKFPGSNEAVNALEMIKNISVEMNNPDYYVNYVEEEGINTNLSDTEKDSLVYTSAEKLYRDNKIEQAVSAFKNYINDYPNGRHLLNAHYYSARCNENLNKTEQALKNYEYVIEQPNNQYTVESLTKAASMSFDKEYYQKAFDYYSKLNQLASKNEKVLIARLGMLRSAYLNKDYENVVKAAKLLLNSDKLSDVQMRETYHKMAKAYYELEKYHLALSQYKNLSNDVTSYEGGEAKYYVAKIYYQQEKDSLAEEKVLEFSNQTAPHRYWLAKSFILLSDIYTDREEYFQARHILQSILDNYVDDTDGIKEEADTKLQQVIELENQEAMQDKSRQIKSPPGDNNLPDDNDQNNNEPEKNNNNDE